MFSKLKFLLKDFLWYIGFIKGEFSPSSMNLFQNISNEYFETFGENYHSLSSDELEGLSDEEAIEYISNKMDSFAGIYKNMKTLTLEIISDYYECDCCGFNFDDGYKIFIDGKNVVDKTPSASCFGGAGFYNKDPFQETFKILYKSFETDIKENKSLLKSKKTHEEKVIEVCKFLSIDFNVVHTDKSIE